jgi:histidinol phosphatase-like PHP family hydrolase
MELIRQADRRSYAAIGITDHIGAGGMERVIGELIADCELAASYWNIIAVPGIELTHIPPGSIPTLAAKAKSAGAKIVIVHGETPAERVPPGTNSAAVNCPDVDILAHPGMIENKEVARAVENNVFLEISGRREHCLCNGRVVTLAREHGAKLIVSSDAHTPHELLNLSTARTIALGAGLTDEEAHKALYENPRKILKKLGYTLR